jgi:O-antigen/teichoic acid export membrane protein
MNLISFLGLLIHQIDKVFVSHYFNLDIFGYYNLATMVTSGFTMLVSPISLTFFPRLSTLVAEKDDKTFRRVYHESSQLVSVAILPAITTGILFANKIIQIWTGDAQVAAKTAPIAAILLIGTALNSLATMPYQAQTAHGWTRLSVNANLISLPLIIGLLFILNASYGILGLAAIWAIYNVFIMVIPIPLMHQRILQGEFKSWFWNDTMIPIIVCLGYAGLVFAMESNGLPVQNSLFALIIFAILIQSSVAFSVPFTRGKAFQILSYGWRRIRNA